MSSTLRRSFVGILGLSAFLAFASPASAQDAPAPEAAPEVPAAPAAEPPRYAARHVLLSYAGAPRTTATRTKEEAKTLADELFAKIKEHPDQFAATAAENSDCTSAPEGGYLGEFGPGAMVAEFEQAVAGAKDGDIVGPVETAFGYHIIQRVAIQDAQPAGLIVVAFGDTASGIGITRSKEEAEARANEALAALAAGKTFAEAAMEFSDAPNKAIGGYAGKIKYGASFPPVLLDAILNAPAGSNTGVIGSERAWFIGRHMTEDEASAIETRLDEKVALRALFLRYQGALGAGEGETRTKEQVTDLANEVKTRVAAGEEFADFVVQFSTTPVEKDRKGELGTLTRRVLPPNVQDVAFALAIGEVGIVEMEEGLLVIQRVEEQAPQVTIERPAEGTAEEAAPAPAPAEATN